MNQTKYFLVVFVLFIGCFKVDTPKDTEKFKYFVGKGEFKRTIQEAHQIATEDIFKQAAEYIGIEVSVSYSSEISESGREFRDKLYTKTDKLYLQSHLIKQNIEEIKDQGLYSITLVAEYPREELEKERKRIEDFRQKKRQLIAESLSKIELAAQKKNYQELQNQFLIVFGNDYSENDQRKVELILAQLFEKYTVDYVETDSTLIINSFPAAYFIFGKNLFRKLNSIDGKYVFSKLSEGYFSPFNPIDLYGKIPVSTLQIIEQFSWQLKRQKTSFSFEFDFNSENQVNLSSFKDNLYSSLTKLGFENNPRQAKFRVINQIESFIRSENIGGVISVGLKINSTIKSLHDKRSAVFVSKEIIGFGGNEKDATKNATDKIQTYLSTEWIENFNYTFYETFN